MLVDNPAINGEMFLIKKKALFTFFLRSSAFVLSVYFKLAKEITKLEFFSGKKL